MQKFTNILSGSFEGWSVSEDRLFDDAGNCYSISEIRSIFFTRQFMETVQGSPHSRTVVTLKEHLQRKIDAVKTPVITIDWGDGFHEEIKHPIHG